MPLPTPVLDNRRYADIVAEATARIPRYTPEWTDHNASDPGMTLVQLFAWMTEMLLFQMNRVPELTYIKFLELLGITLRPAEPARAELTFTVVDPSPGLIVSVPKGTRVAAAGVEGQPPVVFETDEGLQALGAKLAAVLSFDGFDYLPVTSVNGAAAGSGYEPFGPHAERDSALYLGFDFAGAFSRSQINLLVYVAEDGTRTPVLHCAQDALDVPLPVQLVWEGWDGTDWSKLPLDKDETRAFTRSGHIYLRVPRDDSLRKRTLPEAATPLYWMRARVAREGYDRAPRLDAVLINTVSATQAETVTNEVLGGSDGSPDQRFQVFFAPVLAGTLQLEVDEGSGYQRWQEVDDFNGSGPGDLHYTLDRATGVITFPDGERGHLPVANPARPADSVIARTYRHGGGAAGNLPANTITQVQSAVNSVERVTNHRAAEGGADQETVDQAKLRAPQELKSRGRAVTSEDFELLARATPGARIGRAVALPLSHPGFPDVLIPGAITVLVIPDAPGQRPSPSEATLRIVCAWLDQHRLLTAELHVTGPTYREIKVEARLFVRADADLGAVRQGVDDALNRYFHPLTGGEGGQGWPVGGTVFYSLVYKTVLGVAGVDRIDELYIWLDGERQAFCQDVPIGKHNLLYADGHDVDVSYA